MRSFAEKVANQPRSARGLVRRVLSALAMTAGFALLLAMSPAAYAFSPGTKPQSDPSSAQASAWQASSAEGARLVAAARYLEVYLVRNPDGTLGLNAPKSALAKVPAQDVRILTTGLSVLNGKIAAAELQTTPAGAVFTPGSDQMVFQGGWTGHGVAWWGQYWCLSHWDLVNLGNYPNWVYSAAVMALLAIIPGTSGLVAVFVAVYWAWMAWADHGNGSCLNQSWAGGPIWVTSQ